MHKAKWYESPACFKQSDVPVNWYVSRQVTLPVWICHLPKFFVNCKFCNMKYTSDEVSPVICLIVALYLSWSLTYTIREHNDKVLLCYSRITFKKKHKILHACRQRKSHKLYGPSYLSHVTAAATSAEQYWHLQRPENRIERTKLCAFSLRLSWACFRERYLRLKLGNLWI